MSRFYDFFKRITGVSTPVGGITWARKPGDTIEIVDISATEHLPDTQRAWITQSQVLDHQTRVFFPVLDIKLRNPSNTVAFLKRIQIDVLEIVVDPTPTLDFYIHSGAPTSNISGGYTEDKKS